MVKLHSLVWSWSQSFAHTTNLQIFAQLDKEVDRAIAELNSQVGQLIRSGAPETRRRVSGVHLLINTIKKPLPELTGYSKEVAPFPIRLSDERPKFAS